MSKEINEKDVAILSMELKAEIIKLQVVLDKFEKNLELIGNEELWTGPNAYQFFKSGFGNLDHDRELLRNIKKCSNYLDSKISQ